METVIREFCKNVGIQYEPLMYLKAEDGELFMPSNSVKEIYKQVNTKKSISRIFVDRKNIVHFLQF